MKSRNVLWLSILNEKAIETLHITMKRKLFNNLRNNVMKYTKTKNNFVCLQVGIWSNFKAVLNETTGILKIYPSEQRFILYSEKEGQ